MVDPDSGINAKAPVTCFIADGNVAVAGGPSPDVPQGFLYIIVEDNDALGDQVRVGFSNAPANEAGCTFVLTRIRELLVPLDHGNVTVHDAPEATP